MEPTTRRRYHNWPPANYVDPESRKTLLLGVEATITTLALIFVAARFYARTCVKQLLGRDDWCMLAAMTCSIAVTTLHCASTRYATGLHAWDVKKEWYTPASKLTYVSLILYAPTASLAKISLCLTYLRILPDASDRLFSKIAIVFSVCYCIAITLVMTFQCSPVSTYWKYSPFMQFNCINEPVFNFTAQLINSVSDILIFLWPVRTLWTVRVPIRQRLRLVFVFSVGAVVCVAGIFRVYYLWRYFQTWDVFWEGSIIFMLACLESNLGIICGCLPGIKPLLSATWPRIFGSNSMSRTSGSGGGHSITSITYRLPGARLSIGSHRIGFRPPGAIRTQVNRSPSQMSMVEVPIKLDNQWSPVEEPMPVASPRFQLRRMDSRDEFGEMHPGRRMSETV